MALAVVANIFFLPKHLPLLPNGPQFLNILALLHGSITPVVNAADLLFSCFFYDVQHMFLVPYFFAALLP